MQVRRPPAPWTVPALSSAGLLLVRRAGTDPLTIDTTHLGGPAPRGYRVELFPPDTGDGGPHDGALVVVDATRGLVPRR